MTMLRVRRARVPFGDRVLVRGEMIDSSEFPTIDQSKWAQMLDQRYFDLVDVPGRASSRAVAERERAQGIVLDEPDGTRAVSLDCPDCSFVAKNEHGLKVHQGRKHG